MKHYGREQTRNQSNIKLERCRAGQAILSGSQHNASQGAHMEPSGQKKKVEANKTHGAEMSKAEYKCKELEVQNCLQWKGVVDGLCSARSEKVYVKVSV